MQRRGHDFNEKLERSSWIYCLCINFKQCELSAWRNPFPVLSPPSVEEGQSPRVSSSETALPTALKTSPFPDSSSLPEEWGLAHFWNQQSLWVLFHCKHRNGAAGPELLPKRFLLFYHGSAQLAASLWRSSSPAPNLQMEMGERGERKVLAYEWALDRSGDGTLERWTGVGGSAPVDLTRSNAVKPNGWQPLWGMCVSHSTQPSGKKLSRLSSWGRAMKKESSAGVQLTLHARVAVENH